MTPEKQSQIKEHLEAMKASLEKEIAKFETPPDFGDFPGPDDETDESAAFYNQKSAAAALKADLADVESAMIKLEKGTYGLCESCGKKIDEKMLEAIPQTNYCQSCKKERKGQ